MTSRKPPIDSVFHVPPFTRRGLLKSASLVSAAAALSSSCGEAEDSTDPAFEALPTGREGEVLLGHFDPGPDAVKEACDKLDFSWLSPGDSVLLKVASNSAYEHPSTTSGDAIIGMVQYLKDKGAGRVVVADQAGIEWVKYREGDKQLLARTTVKVFEENGIAAAIQKAEAEMHTFDSQPFSTGYFAATEPHISGWKKGVHVPNIIRDVDHIVYLPRLSAHAITGYTMALKLAVGWMRDDTRLEFHQKGGNLYEKYVQVTYSKEIKDRLRLVFTYASHALLDIGPDVGTAIRLPHGTVVASTHPADHDIVGSTLLMAYDDVVPSPLDPLPIWPDRADYFNQGLVRQWGRDKMDEYETFTPASFWKGVAKDPAVRHAYVLDGVRPSKITVKTMGYPVPPHVKNALASYDSGLLDLVNA